MKTRRAVLSDVNRIAQIHVLTWKTVYRGLLPGDYLASLNIGQREEMWKSCIQHNGDLFVLENKEREVVGFLNLGKARDQDLLNATELTAIYLDPSYYASGSGTVFWHAVEKCIQRDCVYAWVLSTNQIGIAFYEKNGFQEDGKNKSFEIEGEVFQEVRYLKQL